MVVTARLEMKLELSQKCESLPSYHRCSVLTATSYSEMSFVELANYISPKRLPLILTPEKNRVGHHRNSTASGPSGCLVLAYFFSFHLTRCRYCHRMLERAQRAQEPSGPKACAGGVCITGTSRPMGAGKGEVVGRGVVSGAQD